MIQRIRSCSRGQTILETVLVIVAVIVVAVAFTNRRGPFVGAVNAMMSLPNDLLIKSNQEIKF